MLSRPLNKGSREQNDWHFQLQQARLSGGNMGFEASTLVTFTLVAAGGAMVSFTRQHGHVTQLKKALRVTVRSPGCVSTVIMNITGRQSD